MKNYIITILFTLTIQQLFSQINFVNNDSNEFKKSEQALKAVISEAQYIVEATWVTNDYYYIKEDNQSYWRKLMKVSKVIRGKDVNVGDTIISIWKQEYKGNGRDERRVSPTAAPRLWYDKKSTSCIFLTDSKYPIEPVADEWSRFKHTTYIPSSIGYFAALYVDENGHRRVSFESGIRFSRMTDWYNFLKQFPNVNAPMRY